MKNHDLRSARFDEDVLSYDTAPLEEDLEHPSSWHINRFFGRFGVKVVGHAREEMEEIDDSDFDVRTSFLPEDAPDDNGEPELFEVRIFSKSRDIWQRTPHKRAIKFALFALCVLLVGVPLFTQLRNAVVSSTSSRTTPTSVTRITVVYTYPHDQNTIVQNADRTVTVDASAMPTYCPINVTGERRQIGNYPIWLSNIQDPLVRSATVHLSSMTLATTNQWKGWAIPLHLTGRRSYTSTISLSITNLADSTIPLLHDPATGQYSQHLLLNMKQSTASQGSTNNVGDIDVTMYLPNAGCYAISAYWLQGHWQMSFAAGK